MHFSNRLLIFLLPVAIPIVLYNISPSLLYVGGAYLVVLFVVSAIDYVTNPLFGKVEISREMNSKFSLGVENIVTLKVANRSQHQLRLRIKDDFPDEFLYETVLHDCRVSPLHAMDVSYRLTPLRRGIYQFVDIHLQCWGVLGLIVRRRRIPASAEIKVYPNLQAVRQYELLVKRGMLHQIGLKTSRQFGEGTEMERLREYSPDDDFRRIDWNATARQRKPIVREFETERSQDVVIMLDTGRLMASPILLETSTLPAETSTTQKAMLKLDYAINTTLMTAYVSMLKGDKVGLIAFADRVHQYLAPKPGKKQFLTMLETIYALPVHPVEPDFAEAFKYLASKQRRRALIILFTDILNSDSAEGIAAYVSQLSKHHLVACVTLTDSGIVELAEQKTKDSKSVYQKAIADRLLQEKHATLEILRRQGVITIDVPAHQLTMAVVNKYLELKAKSRI
ncbi:DUF58 domain-containing protein [Candidatus Poribacteria bacterium]|nr:DUF58 domain-containing protein [Candidatus Poribacteria bacterium]MYH83959.1 DUF58 domain-containing protein [Candidatus Poribacteria bacterium]MYK96651.1 DUF58 domain-containing protein [Candidatus Poribacteria bacterium]